MPSIRFLPVEWHSVIHTRDDAVKRQLEAITLPSVPILRNNDLTFIIRYPGRAGSMTNDCISDVLFYQGSEYQYKIREEVVQNINNTVRCDFVPYSDAVFTHTHFAFIVAQEIARPFYCFLYQKISDSRCHLPLDPPVR